jgi:hypothetical protein
VEGILPRDRHQGEVEVVEGSRPEGRLRSNTNPATHVAGFRSWADCAPPYFFFGVYLNFWPPMAASYMSPPLATVKTAIPLW